MMRFSSCLGLKTTFLTYTKRTISSIEQVQGQTFLNEHGKQIREYFYYLDHQGQVIFEFIVFLFYFYLNLSLSCQWV